MRKSSRKEPVPPEGYVWVARPYGARSSDKFGCIKVKCDCPECAPVKLGAKSGDHIIVFKTDDVQDGDVGHAIFDDKKSVYGEIRMGALWIGINGERYDRSELKLIGRIVEIQRDGRRIKPTKKLRPIHARRNTARKIEKELNLLNPMFSIQNGELRISM